MEELIKSFRLGVVQIFGILLPGLALLFSLAYPLSIVEYPLTDKLATAWNEHRIEVAAIVLILAYVLGFVIRLIPTEWLDCFGIWWRNKRQGVEGKRLIGAYPYRNFKDVLGHAGLAGLGDYVKWDKNGPLPTRAQVNSLKLLVASENEVLATSLTSTEANIRMMFGLFVAGLAAEVVLVGSVLVQSVIHRSFEIPSLSFSVVIATIGCGLFMIFHTFTSTRCTELVRLALALRVCAADKDSKVDAVLKAFEYSPEAKAYAQALAAGVVPEVSGKAARRCRRSPGSERMAEDGAD